jgi:Tryptophan dimethylallyltransferase
MVLTGPGSEHGDINAHLNFANFPRKITIIYFSLSPDNPNPAPKIGIYPPNFAANDGVIARGLNTWLRKYNWTTPSKSLEDQLRSVL